jgi:hypothetical protein
VCSDHAGRANKINDLRNSFRRRAKGKLTINSPTERAHSRAIGGNLARLLPWTRPHSRASLVRESEGSVSTTFDLIAVRSDKSVVH